jgi:hypothetical protein
MLSSHRYSASKPRRSRICNAIGASLLAGVLVSTVGCSSLSFGGGRLVKELEAENDRLLAEFRAERDRRESIEKALRRTQQRLAESEKQLAQQFSLGASRLSQLPSGALSGSSSNSTGYSRPAPFSSEFSGATNGAATNGNLSNSGLRWMRRRP